MEFNNYRILALVFGVIVAVISIFMFLRFRKGETTTQVGKKKGPGRPRTKKTEVPETERTTRSKTRAARKEE